MSQTGASDVPKPNFRPAEGRLRGIFVSHSVSFLCHRAILRSNPPTIFAGQKLFVVGLAGFEPTTP